MATQYVCPRGHQWTGDAAVPAQARICPVCGTLGASSPNAGRDALPAVILPPFDPRSLSLDHGVAAQPLPPMKQRAADAPALDHPGSADSEPPGRARWSDEKPPILRAKRRSPLGVAMGIIAVLLLVLCGGGGLLIWHFDEVNRHRWQANNARRERDELRRQLQQRAQAEMRQVPQAGQQPLPPADNRVPADQVQRDDYFQNIALANWEHRDGQPARAARLLKNCPQPFRDWEWHYLQRLCSPELLTVHGHTGSIGCIAFSPDGKRLVSCSMDRTAQLWDPATGKVVHTLPSLNGGGVAAAAFSPDGAKVAFSSWGFQVPAGQVELWDVANGARLRTFRGHTGHVNGVAYSPDGTKIVSGSHDGTLKIWDTATGKEVLTVRGHKHEVVWVAWSPDGAKIASTASPQGQGNQVRGEIKIWDAANGQELHDLKGHRFMATEVAFSPDSTRLVSGSTDKTVKIWDTKTGQEILTLRGHEDAIWSVIFSRDGKQVASAAADRTARVWDAASGKQLHSFVHAPMAGQPGGQEKSIVVQSVSFNADDTVLGTGSADETVRLWSLTPVKGPAPWPAHKGMVSGLAFDATGTRLASAGHDKKVILWDALTSKEIHSFSGHTRQVVSVAFRADGARLVSCTGAGDENKGEIKIWDTADGKEVRTIAAATTADARVTFSGDGRHIVLLQPAQVIKVWDAESGEPVDNLNLALRTSAADMENIAWSADGKRQAVIKKDKTVRVSDGFQDRFPSWNDADGPVRGLAFSGDGQRVALMGANKVRVFEVTSAKPFPDVRCENVDVRRVCLSRDGRRLALAGQRKTVVLFDLNSGQENEAREIVALHGPPDDVSSLAFSADGRRLAVACVDGSLIVLDAGSRSAPAAAP